MDETIDRSQGHRGLMLRGATLSEVTRDLWPLGLFLAVTLSLAIVRFRKRLD